MSITIQNLDAFTEVASEAYWEGINHEFTFKDDNNQEYTFKVLDTKKVYSDEEEPEKGYYRDITLESNGKQYSFSYMDEMGLDWIEKLTEIKPKVEPRWQKPFEEFKAYLEANPEQRFWQALRNVSKADFINHNGQDTFYWEGLTKR